MAKSQQQPRTDNHWEQVARTPVFQELIRKKKRFILPASVFFLLYYFALPVVTGYSDILNTKVSGGMNWVYLFALSQFFMAWILSLIYVWHANKTDQLVQRINDQKEEKQ
ncbi:hypothetical protein GCM10011571_06330 [Marinithermofilum abyssi]|uniref:DUF485 domain-containing protein n=1 Tax=Marinithermofilum abyssi TaxID=1571185 RepID=A0A8J2VGI5_9BACL|nr:DUF485 domain-containing protein [Marinithermofilum abyssi]GGE07816.1 hypothetical protein GCM10011571_06330 [Marinithermofilum abyssi]